MNLVGTTLGQFQIVEELGRGGMATVYKAYQASLQRHVALKVLAPALAQDMDVVKRFLREAQTAAALRHANVITIYDVGSDEDIHYIVAEYLEGITLAQLLDTQGGALPLARIMHIVRQVSDALDYAHARGYVHRDIKPSNIMVDPARDDHVTLMDFGLVQVASGSRITRSGYIVGTPDYMSPEQAKGEPIDRRTDVYSLGVTTYHMLTGNVPFAKPTPHAVLLAHVMEEPPAMSALGTVTPPEVEAVVIKSMAKDPADRYDWASDMANDLETAITAVDLGALDTGALAPQPAPDAPAPAARSTPVFPSGRAPDVAAPSPAPAVQERPSAATTAPEAVPLVRRAPGGTPGRSTRPRWLWPVVGLLAAGTLVVLVLACVLLIPVLNRLAQGAAMATVAPSATPVATARPTATLSPTVAPTATPASEATAEADTDPTVEAGGPLYMEDFSSPGAEWEVSENEGARYRVDAGAYSIEVIKTNWIAWNLIGQELADFEVEFEVALVEGDRYNDAGLLFRFQDADNYYEIDINGEGSFAIGKEVNDEWVQIVEWTSDPSVQAFGRVNRVRLVAEGTRFTLYINDEYLASFSDDSFGSGGIGPVVTAYDEPPARATFDNIKIWAAEQE
jgi:tRNA A-37 threonylcarbamoyl transferase component Bud32